MDPLRNDRYLDALMTQSALFAEALHGADLQQRVPTCPDWAIYQLTEHLGQAHRWGTAIVTRPATTPPDPSIEPAFATESKSIATSISSAVSAGQDDPPGTTALSPRPFGIPPPTS